jgi:Zn-dependent protease
MLACPACRKIVHGARLSELAADAEAAEREGRTTDALTHWRAALALLPATTNQARAIGDRIRRLGDALEKSGAPAGATQGNRAGGAAGLGAAAALLWKLKFVALSLLAKAKLLATGLASLPTLLSMLAYVSVRGGGERLPWAIGIVASIYVHEVGHVWALRLYGIEATPPMFVPGFGAFVRLKQYPVDAREDARVGLAGPEWGCVASIVAMIIGFALGNPTALSVGSLAASINLFNLIPFWQLDGARGFRALDARQRGIVVALAAGAALITGQVMGWLVCAVGGLRLRADLPAQGDARAFRSFAGLVVVLSALAWVAERSPSVH